MLADPRVVVLIAIVTGLFRSGDDQREHAVAEITRDRVEHRHEVRPDAKTLAPLSFTMYATSGGASRQFTSTATALPNAAP